MTDNIKERILAFLGAPFPYSVDGGVPLRSMLDPFGYSGRKMSRKDRKAYTKAIDELVAAGKVKRTNSLQGAVYKLTNPLELLSEIE